MVLVQIVQAMTNTEDDCFGSIDDGGGAYVFAVLQSEGYK